MAPLATYLVQTLLGLALIGIVGVALIAAARRVGLSHRGGPLSLAGHLPLDARRAIYLVRVGNVVYVIGASEAGLTKLGELESSAIPDVASIPAGTLLPVIGRFLNRSETLGESGRP